MYPHETEINSKMSDSLKNGEIFLKVYRVQASGCERMFGKSVGSLRLISNRFFVNIPFSDFPASLA